MRSHSLLCCLITSVFIATSFTGYAKETVTVTVDSVENKTESISEILPDRPYSYEFDLKTNLLRDVVGTINIAAEMKVAPRASISMGLDWNPWTFKNNVMYKRWSLSGEARWWPSQKGEYNDDNGRKNSALTGHFLGFHILGGEFNYNRVTLPFNSAPALNDYRFEGWMAGAGISYGYRYNVSKRVALEASIGMGAIYSDYNKYHCDRCGERIGKGSKLYVGPTQTSFSLIVRMGPNPRMTPPMLKTINHNIEITRTIEITRETTDTIYVAAEVPVPVTTDATASIRQADFSLRLTYPLNSSVIEPALGNNAVQLDSLKTFLNAYAEDPTIRIKSIDIVGYASIEGNATANLRLSDRRAEAAAALVKAIHPELGSLVEARGVGEDWDSLDFPEKVSLMRITNLDERERRLREINHGATFENLILSELPATRRIECIINYTLIEF